MTTTVGTIRIAGAGPAGLTLAAALLAAGTPPERIVVHETIDEAAATGVGAFLGLSPTIFGELGERSEFAPVAELFAHAPRIDAIRLVQPDGADLTRPLPAPLRMVTRHGLVAALLDAARALGADVRFRSPIPATDETSTDHWTIGADGVHSTVRRSPGFAHLAAATAPGTSARFAPGFSGPAPDPAPNVLTFFRGDGGSAAGFLTDARGTLAFTRTPDGARLGELGFSLGPDVLAALDAQSGRPIQIWEIALPERLPGGGNPWRAGRSVLIGDAAHAKSPASGSGAADAITDALHVTPALHSGAEAAVTAALDELLDREALRRTPPPR
ncbi:FAD-dependent monooxygenase [Tsukamurella strandjordii]|uniref:FAD-dependent monooxygenase n=1 Tax=Tsukamurella strandjordii TaxID=147577 RepID=UPI0031DB7205